MCKLTKTEQTLLERAKTAPNGRIWCEGVRETKAARKLLERGLAVDYTPCGNWSGGEYKVCPFHRVAYTTKRVYISACQITITPQSSQD